MLINFIEEFKMDKEEKRIEIVHVKRKDFLSSICDVIAMTKNIKNVTILFSMETNDIISESFVGDGDKFRPSENPVKVMQIREDIARVSMSMDVANSLFLALKNVFERDGNGEK
jgi:hypothetical protein